MEEKSFLGKGMKFPPQINKATGRFEVASEVESVKQSIYLILMTQVGERMMNPGFGSQIMSYAFMDVSVTTISLLTRELQSVILRQEPRVSNVTIDTEQRQNEGLLIINIGYTIIGENVRDNLVFPFYLNVDQAPQDDFITDQSEYEEYDED